MATSRNGYVRVVVALGLVAALYGGVSIAQQRASAVMANAATAWLASLTPEQRAKATFPLNADERTHWNFIPTSMFPRNGLPLKEMTPAQQKLAHDVLKASIGQVGYQTATTVMSLEDVLKATEGPGQPVRDPELYFLSIFGTPSPKGAWAMRYEGHHLSMHFSIDGAKAAVVTTPFFMGANPAEVRQGPRMGVRALATQEDTARALLGALTDAQKAVAVIAPTPPGEIATTTTVKVDPLSPAGLMAADMTSAQRDLLMKIIDSYTAVQTADVSADRMAKIKAAGTEKIGFVWAGSTEKGQRYHYRVQGPTFLIEHNNTQNQGNHIHSVWRDFNGDFGRDLLAEHLKALPH